MEASANSASYSNGVPVPGDESAPEGQGTWQNSRAAPLDQHLPIPPSQGQHQGIIENNTEDQDELILEEVVVVPRAPPNPIRNQRGFVTSLQQLASRDIFEHGPPQFSLALEIILYLRKEADHCPFSTYKLKRMLGMEADPITGGIPSPRSESNNTGEESRVSNAPRGFMETWQTFLSAIYASYGILVFAEPTLATELGYLDGNYSTNGLSQYYAGTLLLWALILFTFAGTKDQKIKGTFCLAVIANFLLLFVLDIIFAVTHGMDQVYPLALKGVIMGARILTLFLSFLYLVTMGISEREGDKSTPDKSI